METDTHTETIACLDVGYAEAAARAACVVIADWRASIPVAEHVAKIHEVKEYQPGEFYRRELPCIQAVLEKLDQPPTYVVVDGYVWLDGNGRPGLGAHLYETLDRKIPVIGVAKNPFKDTDHATELRRGTSDRPLYVTAVGIPIAQAVLNIGEMHGPHRLPAILKRVDQLSRGGN
ncbi:endonuclease V [Crateriforma conspicua]|uniref:Endonuclease V n=1 Tax=Crateriforma conspicua TaxID=2527996 RepID=A0A5C5Y0Z9_9PLAN|nr:endonuclease V [Crateriforma conspicua]TWT68830.1 Endonuclease V [Crateriforma conspicua]